MLEKISAKLHINKENNQNKINVNPVLLTGGAGLGLLEAVSEFRNTRVLYHDKIELLKDAKKLAQESTNGENVDKKSIKEINKQLKKINWQSFRSGLFGAIKGVGIAACFGLIALGLQKVMTSKASNQEIAEEKPIEIQQEAEKQPVEEVKEQTQVLDAPSVLKMADSAPTTSSEVQQIKQIASQV